MEPLAISRIVLLAAAAICLAALALRLDAILRRPRRPDLTRPRGSRSRGILYAFTLGMAPWEKESGRLHWVAYVRGVLLHVGVFLSFVALLVSPWLAAVPAWLALGAALVTLAGALAGIAAIAMRFLDRNARALSLPDDYLAVTLCSMFAASATVALLRPALLPAFYLVASVLLIYIPFGKIRHCIYFFFAKFFYGESAGRRGVIGHAGGHSGGGGR